MNLQYLQRHEVHSQIRDVVSRIPSSANKKKWVGKWRSATSQKNTGKVPWGNIVSQTIFLGRRGSPLRSVLVMLWVPSWLLQFVRCLKKKWICSLGLGNTCVCFCFFAAAGKGAKYCVKREDGSTASGWFVRSTFFCFGSRRRWWREDITKTFYGMAHELYGVMYMCCALQGGANSFRWCCTDQVTRRTAQSARLVFGRFAVRLNESTFVDCQIDGYARGSFCLQALKNNLLSAMTNPSHVRG